MTKILIQLEQRGRVGTMLDFKLEQWGSKLSEPKKFSSFYHAVIFGFQFCRPSIHYQYSVVLAGFIISQSLACD
jgi:hypothetical protein